MAIRVLVGCECSQVVCSAFRSAGCEAFSCDVQDCYGGHPEWHIKADVLSVVDDTWDLFICRPPCTYLCQLNMSIYSKFPEAAPARILDGWLAKDFFMKCLNAPVRFKCIENPRPLRVWGLPPYSELIHPYEFGHPFKKSTCLWLRNLPPLFSTDIIDHRDLPSWHDCAFSFRGSLSRGRSHTFAGIADAMAKQWLPFVLEKKIKNPFDKHSANMIQYTHQKTNDA